MNEMEIAQAAVDAAFKRQSEAMGNEGRALAEWLRVKPSALANPSSLEKKFGFEARRLNARQEAARKAWKTAQENLRLASEALANAEERCREVKRVANAALIAALRAAGPLPVRALALTLDKTGEEVIWTGVVTVDEEGALVLPDDAPHKSNGWQVMEKTGEWRRIFYYAKRGPDGRSRPSVLVP